MVRRTQRTLLFETLESRTLFAGVTILTHGLAGEVDGWVDSLSTAIVARAGGSANASVYTLVVDDNSGGLRVSSFTRDSGYQDYQTTGGGEVIIKLDWTDVDLGRYSTGSVANVVSSYLTVKHGSTPALTELPIHLIGHSRGASLMVGLTKRLGEKGIWVDQLTGLDPHPVDGHNDFLDLDFGDTPMASYVNVVYSESYWRTNGRPEAGIDPNGEPIPGGYNLNLQVVQNNHSTTAHSAVPAYYEGTADLSAESNGDHIPILAGWYGNTPDKPPRNATGYYYSHIVRGTPPNTGVGNNFGGVGARTNLSVNGAQAPDVAVIKLANGSSFEAGHSVRLDYRFADRDGSANVVWSIDRDTNPYNGNDVRVGARTTFSQTQNPTAASVVVGNSGVETGTYYLYAAVTDSTGLTRFNYANRPVSIVGTSGAMSLSAPPATFGIIATARPKHVWEQLENA